MMTLLPDYHIFNPCIFIKKYEKDVYTNIVGIDKHYKTSYCLTKSCPEILFADQQDQIIHNRFWTNRKIKWIQHIVYFFP